MKKFWNLNNRGSNNQIITRRSNMNRRIVVGIIGGLALAAVIGTSVGLTGPNRAESLTIPTVTESSQAPLESFAYFSIEPGTSIMDDSAKVADVETQLPSESFAYWSIEPGTSLIADNAKAGDVRTDLPNESFAYWSIEPGRAIVGNAN